MKTLCMLIFLVPALSSCFTYKNLTRRGEPVTEDIRLKIQLYKKHTIHYKSGEVIQVIVTKMDSTTLYGNIFSKNGTSMDSLYRETIQDLQRNATAVSVRKFNPYVTTGVIAGSILAGIIITEFIVVEVASSIWSIF